MVLPLRDKKTVYGVEKHWYQGKRPVVDAKVIKKRHGKFLEHRRKRSLKIDFQEKGETKNRATNC